MLKKGFNLEKTLENRDNNDFTPSVIYFIRNPETNKLCEGYIDGSADGRYKGLLQGKNDFKEINLDESIFQSENPLYTICEKLLDIGCTIFLKFGLLSVGYDPFEENGIEYETYGLSAKNLSFDAKINCEKSSYDNGTFGIFIKKDKKGNYQYDYGYQYFELFIRHYPPERTYNKILGSPKDEVEEGIIKLDEELIIIKLN